MTTPEFETPTLLRALQASQIPHISEVELQEGVAKLLDGLGISYQKEFVLNAEDRIDFLLPGGVGLEIKIQESLTDVTRQLHRYAQCEQITALVLLTTRMAHRRMPGSIGGKPVYIAYQSPL